MKHGDSRGFFSETYNSKRMAQLGLDLEYVQDNQSLSTEKYTMRGLHFQIPPFDQDKLVRVLRGSVLDVAVDLRKESETYGNHIAVELSASKFNQILVPRGFAHGILTLEEDTEIFYKVSNYYSAEHDYGIIWNDKTLGIDWGVSENLVITSDKDRVLPEFKSLDSYF